MRPAASLETESEAAGVCSRTDPPIAIAIAMASSRPVGRRMAAESVLCNRDRGFDHTRIAASGGVRCWSDYSLK